MVSTGRRYHPVASAVCSTSTEAHQTRHEALWYGRQLYRNTEPRYAARQGPYRPKQARLSRWCCGCILLKDFSDSLWSRSVTTTCYRSGYFTAFCEVRACTITTRLRWNELTNYQDHMQHISGKLDCNRRHRLILGLEHTLSISARNRSSRPGGRPGI